MTRSFNTCVLRRSRCRAGAALGLGGSAASAEDAQCLGLSPSSCCVPWGKFLPPVTQGPALTSGVIDTPLSWGPAKEEMNVREQGPQ